MADQGRWFKLWVGADDDPDLANLPEAYCWKWCKLGLYTKEHGTGGIVVIKKPASALQRKLQTTSYEELLSVLNSFPNIVVQEAQNYTVSPETILTVSWRNWHKYQGDISTQRVREFRQMKRSKKRREEKRRDSILINKNTTSPTPSSESQFSSPENWGTPEALIVLYNSEAADELSAVEKITAGRVKRAKDALKKNPERAYWLEVFQETKKSEFLRGLRPSNGHVSFRADFDWLMANGRDGIENHVKVYEGKYRDG